MASLTTIISNLLPRLHASSTANLVHWTNGELTAFGDESIKRLGREVGVFLARGTISLSNGTAQYSLPSRHVSTVRVTHNGIPLIPSSTDELEYLNSAYLTTTGTPTHFYQDKQGFAKISFYPVPNTAAAALTLSITYHEWPAELDSGGANVTIPGPLPIAGDYIQARVHAEAVGKESDGAIPEVAAFLNQKLEMLQVIIADYWGAAQ